MCAEACLNLCILELAMWHEVRCSLQLQGTCACGGVFWVYLGPLWVWSRNLGVMGEGPAVADFIFPAFVCCEESLSIVETSKHCRGVFLCATWKILILPHQSGGYGTSQAITGPTWQGKCG